MKNLYLESMVTVLVSLVSLTASAQRVQISGIHYDLDDDAKTAQVVSGEYIGEVVIPKSIEYLDEVYSVTAIDRHAFSYCESLKSVVIPNGVTSIGDEAFDGCSSLASIIIPNSVNSIGYDAFKGTSWLKNQENGVVYAGNVVYKYKGEIPPNTSITIKDGTVAIAKGAFAECGGLTSIIIPSSVTCIGESAFSGCYDLNSIVIPNGVTSIEDYTFSGCFSLKTVTIPNSVTSIGESAFSACENLLSVIIPNSVTSIRFGAFSGCSKLASLTIPQSVIEINSQAFVGCRGLTSIDFPDYIPDIATDAFNETAWYDDQEDGLIYMGKMVYRYKGEMPENTNLTIKEGTTYINSSAFFNCNGLLSVVIPNSVTSIGESAFSGVDNLTSVSLNSDAILNKSHDYAPTMQGIFGEQVTNYTIGDDVTSIGSEVFKDCTNLEYVTIGNNVKSIGEKAFENCTHLTSVRIPNSVTSIGESAFSGCNNLTFVSLDNNAVLSGLRNRFGEQVQFYLIGQGVTSIGEGAFWDCGHLTSVIILGNVVSIEENAFSGCSIDDVQIEDLEAWCRITFKDNPLNTAQRLLLNAEEVKDLVIPNSITSINDNAFSGFSGLTSVTIPNNVTSIGENAFSNCRNLTSATISNGVTSIGIGAFSGCSSLASLTIPGSVVTIGGSAFSNCSGLTSVFMSNGVTSIERCAFYSCENLASVTIPQSVKKIGDSAFRYCGSLRSVVSLNPTPPEMEKDSKYSVFDYETYSQAVLQVPKGSVALYKAADEWKNFAKIEEVDGETNIEGVKMGSTTEIVAHYNIEGQTAPSHQQGVHIIRMSDGTTRKVLVK